MTQCRESIVSVADTPTIIVYLAAFGGPFYVVTQTNTRTCISTLASPFFHRTAAKCHPVKKWRNSSKPNTHSEVF
ncbi:MAG: hypothetical protein ACI9SP_004193 [Arenicella sp.]|jgi:hypothetical protein